MSRYTPTKGVDLRDKPRLKRVWVTKHPWTDKAMTEPEWRWGCEGWDSDTPFGAWFMWWYDGPRVPLSQTVRA